MSPRWIFGIVWIDWKIHVCAKCRDFCFYLIIEHCIYTRPIYTPSKTLLETHDRCNKQLQGIEQKCKAWILKVLLWNYDENINKIGCFFFLLILCHEEIARITHWNVIGGTNDQARPYRFFFVLRSQENSSRGTVKPCAENHVRNRRRSSSIRNRYCVCDYEICNIFFFFFPPEALSNRRAKCGLMLWKIFRETIARSSLNRMTFAMYAWDYSIVIGRLIIYLTPHAFFFLK